MDRDDVIACLRPHEQELRGLGVRHLSLFGSVARGKAVPGSDVDLAAELDRQKGIGAFGLIQLSDRLAELVGSRVDLISEPLRRPRLQEEVNRDRINVF